MVIPRRIIGPLALLLALTFSPPAAAAESVRKAVQVRKYAFAEELRLAVGSMPLDPFQKGWTGSLSWSHHFGPVWAWEVLQVTGALLTSTSLRDELIGAFGRRPEEFAAPRFMVTTGLEASPVYGKQVWLNQDTLHTGILVGGYAGVLFGDRPTFEQTLEDIRPVVGGGLGFRVYMSQLISTRFDSRIYASFRRAFRDGESFEVETIALFTLSLSLGFGDRR
ncbi:MAG: hypothetical protein AAFU79_25635 [Myxococcota bacterium]